MAAIDLDKIRRYFSTQPVLKAWLFGSFARGEQTDNSDVDLLVTFDGNAKVSLLKHAGMMIELQEILKRPVDLVRDISLYPEIKPYVDADKILIYER